MSGLKRFDETLEQTQRRVAKHDPDASPVHETKTTKRPPIADPVAMAPTGR
jgi:hypothetical protein